MPEPLLSHFVVNHVSDIWLSLGTLTKGGPGADFGKSLRPGSTLNECCSSWGGIGESWKNHMETGRRERCHSQRQGAM